MNNNNFDAGRQDASTAANESWTAPGFCTHNSGSAAAKDWWTAEWFLTWLQLAHRQ